MRLENILKKIETKRVLVIGDVILDHYIWGQADRLSPEAPVPVVNVKKDIYVLGGAANVALNIAKLGAKSDIMGIVGEDSSGEHCKRLLQESCIGTECLITSKATPTILKTRVMAQQQQVCRIDREAKSSDYTLGKDYALKCIDNNIHNWDAFLVSDYAKGVVDNSWIQDLVTIAHQHKKWVCVDPKPLRTINLMGVDILTPNRIEAFKLAEIEPNDTFPAEAICKKIWDKYKPKRLVITLGADGMLLSEEGKVLKHIPTYAREVFDVSGAGDTVIACLTLALATQATLEEAAHLANTAAGIVVSKLGTATTTPQEILQFHA